MMNTKLRMVATYLWRWGGGRGDTETETEGVYDIEYYPLSIFMSETFHAVKHSAYFNSVLEKWIITSCPLMIEV